MDSSFRPFYNIGIIAHNEERNIGLLLNEFLRQAENLNLPFGIIVIASGCTDKTEQIARDYENKDSRIRVFIQRQRQGKARAINLFLNLAKGDLSIVSSADIIPADNALEEILRAFNEPLVGMVGVRVVPRDSFGITGRLNSLLWELHHETALRKAKLGELIAFRNIIKQVPEETAADEAAIEALVTQKGLKIKYLPEVKIFNYTPKDLLSFYKKRVRIFVGHLYVTHRMGYKVATFSIIPLISVVIKKIISKKMNIILILFLVFLEASARLVASYYFFIRKKTYAVWDR